MHARAPRREQHRDDDADDPGVEDRHLVEVLEELHRRAGNGGETPAGAPELLRQAAGVGQRELGIARRPPVQRSPDHRRRAGQDGVADPRRPVGGQEAPQEVQAAQQPRLGAHEPRAGQQHEHRRAAPRTLRLERRRPHHEGQVGDVDVAARGEEGEVEARAQQGGGRQPDERPERGPREAVQAGGEDDERGQRGADHDAIGGIAHDRQQRPEGDGERVLRRRAVAVEGRLDPVEQLAAPQQRVVAVVVGIGRVDQEPDQRAQREGRERQRGP
jgi:hypothetical protein